MIDRIRELAREKNAIILAHNYQPPEIQDLADLCGDSLELSIQAAQTDTAVIVFCGVHFMAETASILCPDKTVLLPQRDAGCPMADMITREALEEKLGTLPSMPVVTYVNSPASVKAISTICCTSANAVDVVGSLGENEILMVPDRNLSRYTASKTDKRIHYWDGYCPYHDLLTPRDVQRAKDAHPEAVFIAHPECRLEVLQMADAVLSTSGMLKYVRESAAAKFIIGTEIGLLYALQQVKPEAEFYPAAETMLCRDMKKISPQDVLQSLENMAGRVQVPEDVRVPALSSVQRMVGLAR